VVLTNAEKQRRWRARRDKLAKQAIRPDDSDRDIVRKVVNAVGLERARALAGSMDRLITAIARKRR